LSVRRKAGAALVACAAVATLAGCGSDPRPDQWDAFVYPGDDLLTHETIRGFKTFELCQAAATERLAVLRTDGGGDYECGYKCGYEPGLSGNVCKETRK
jgi:hypothetical protein